MLVDPCSITSITNDGEKPTTNRPFPDETDTGTELTVSGGAATVERPRIYGYDDWFHDAS